MGLTAMLGNAIGVRQMKLRGSCPRPSPLGRLQCTMGRQGDGTAITNGMEARVALIKDSDRVSSMLSLDSREYDASSLVPY